jgi:hypothetical protein
VFCMRFAPTQNMGAVFSGRGPCQGYVTKPKKNQKSACEDLACVKIRCPETDSGNIVKE